MVHGGGMIGMGLAGTRKLGIQYEKRGMEV